MLEVRPGVTPGGKPPVRIFLGTEDAQYRAERIFFYSIEKRARSRRGSTRVHLMKNLAGFNRKGWRTGFTNYRFAIPDFAGRAGQGDLQRRRPDLPRRPGPALRPRLGGHGYLAISAKDTSVMLIDCARMADLEPGGGHQRRQGTR